MGIENLSPLAMTHVEASVETILDMRESFDEFDHADLEVLFALLEEQDNE